jgi:hypothetical protein
MEGFKQAHCASRDRAASEAQTTEWPKHKPMCQSRRNAEVSHCHTHRSFSARRCLVLGGAVQQPTSPQLPQCAHHSGKRAAMAACPGSGVTAGAQQVFPVPG